MPILSLTIWLPILAGLVIIALGNSTSRYAALGVAVLTFLVSCGLWLGFDTSTAAMQFVEKAEWLPQFNISYNLGVDGISMPLIVLTTLINIIVVISAWEVIKDRTALYLGSFQIMTGLMVGVFSALDAILFYRCQGAVLDLLSLLCSLCGEDSDVACAHMATGCAR